MPEVLLECLYCGKTWKDLFYGSQPTYLRCPVCRDQSIRVRSKEEVVIDTYVGAPAFPPRYDDDE